MLEQYCSHSKQCNNNVVTLCCAKIVPCNIPLRTSIMKFACWGACSPFRVSNAFQIDVLNLVTCSSTPGLTWELCSVVEVPEDAFLPADKSLDERKKWLCSSGTITGYPCVTFWTSPLIHLDCQLFWGTNKSAHVTHVRTKSSSKEMHFACTCLRELRERTTRLQISRNK